MLDKISLCLSISQRARKSTKLIILYHYSPYLSLFLPLPLTLSLSLPPSLSYSLSYSLILSEIALNIFTFLFELIIVLSVCASACVLSFQQILLFVLFLPFFLSHSLNIFLNNIACVFPYIILNRHGAVIICETATAPFKILYDIFLIIYMYVCVYIYTHMHIYTQGEFITIVALNIFEICESREKIYSLEII